MKFLNIRVSRDSILFLSGLAGIGYETLVQHGEKPTLLVLFAAMVGLPAFLRTDEGNNGRSSKSSKKGTQDSEEGDRLK